MFRVGNRFVLRILLLLLVSVPVYATECVCIALPLCERMRKAPVVFLGETVDDGVNFEEDSTDGRRRRLRLKALEAFRGIPEGQEYVEVMIPPQPGPCASMPYRLGARTLVMLSTQQGGVMEDAGCSSLLIDGEGDRNLDLVRSYFAGEPTKVVGTVLQSEVPYMDQRQPLEAANVFVAGEHSRRHQVKTSPDGSFAIIGLAPGRYRLWAAKFGYKSRRWGNASFELEEHGCAIKDLALWADNSVSGSVVDPKGEQVEGAKVFFRPRGQPALDGWGLLDHSDANGAFRFENIAPGLYDAVVSPFGPRPESPYPTAYQGRALDEVSPPIEVGTRSQIDGVRITLADPVPLRRVRFDIDWPDEPKAYLRMTCIEEGRESPALPVTGRDPFDLAIGNGCNILAGRRFRVVVEQVVGAGREYNLTTPREFLIPPGVEDIELELNLSEADFARPRR